MLSLYWYNHNLLDYIFIDLYPDRYSSHVKKVCYELMNTLGHILGRILSTQYSTHQTRECYIIPHFLSDEPPGRYILQ